MPKVADININFNYGEGYWTVSDTSNEFDDHEAAEPADVETVVSRRRLPLEHRGYRVRVHYPPDKKELDEQLDALFDD